jgi:hypothetical protein
LANPDNIIIGAAVVLVNGTDLGYTKNGQTVRYKPEFISVVADQANGTVRKGRSQESMFIKFTLLEVSLEQLRIAMMQPHANLPSPYAVLTLGYNDACFTDEVEIELQGPGPDCGDRTFNFPRCVITDAERMYEMKRDQEVMFEMEFEVLKDSSGHFGTITDA